MGEIILLMKLAMDAAITTGWMLCRRSVAEMVGRDGSNGVVENDGDCC